MAFHLTTRFKDLPVVLGRLRRSYKRACCALCGLTVIAALLSLLAAFVVLDYFFHLPQAACWTVFFIGVAAIIVGTVLIIRFVTKRISDASMAVRVENTVPGIRNRLINAVQLGSDAPEGSVMAARLLHELPFDSTRISLSRIVPARKLRNTALWATLALGLLAFIAGMAPQAAQRSVSRALLPMRAVAPYAKTHIDEVLPGNVSIESGTSVRISALVSGAIPNTANARLVTSGGKERQISLTKTSDTDGRGNAVRFSADTVEIYEAQRYRVQAGDTRSEWFAVSLKSAPKLLAWEAAVTPPSSIGRKAYKLTHEATETAVPAGALVSFSGTCDLPLKQASVSQGETLLARNVPAPQENKKVFTLRFRVRNGGAIQLSLKAANGLDAFKRLPFSVILDKPPSIAIRNAQREHRTTRRAEIALLFTATDDRGIQRVTLERVRTRVLTRLKNLAPQGHRRSVSAGVLHYRLQR